MRLNQPKTYTAQCLVVRYEALGDCVLEPVRAVSRMVHFCPGRLRHDLGQQPPFCLGAPLGHKGASMAIKHGKKTVAGLARDCHFNTVGVLGKVAERGVRVRGRESKGKGAQ